MSIFKPGSSAKSVVLWTFFFLGGFLSGARADQGQPVAPALGDLGFSASDLQSDPEFQKQLDIRSDMLHVHQVLGLVTAVPLVTTYVLGLTTSSSVEQGSTDTNLHAALGLTTTGLYLTTASFAIFAPKPEGLKPSGSTQIHETLVWIHAPLMILTPLLGDMVNDRVQNHQPLGDLGTIHAIAATTLVTSYLAALVMETLNL
ncbi:MAG TPA: hypothetical protein VMU88_03970 [bacterium]|nr:hypothetical protein [bacterium]